MKLIFVSKPNGVNYIVLLMQHKYTKDWSYVNLTKQHICPCKFRTYDEAIHDLENQVKEGKVISWKIINNFNFSLLFNKIKEMTDNV
jgi:hypothetical protein